MIYRQLTFLHAIEITEGTEYAKGILSEWRDMPEFIQEDRGAIKQLVVNFETEDDLKSFSDLLGINITMKTKGIFYPPKPKGNKKIYTDAT